MSNCVERDDIDSTINVANGKSVELSQHKKNTSYWDTTPSKLTDGNLSLNYEDSVAWGNAESEGVIQGNITPDLSAILDNIAKISILAGSHPYYYPTKIMVLISDDKKTWTPVGYTRTMLNGGFWDIIPKRKVNGRYVKVIVEKNDCGGVKERFHVSEVQVFRAILCQPTQIERNIVVPPNIQMDWAFTACGGFAFLTYYLTADIFKVRISDRKLIDQTILTTSAPPSCSHSIPENNHIIIGGQTGTYVAVDMDTLEVVEDNSDGHFPAAGSTDKCSEGIAHDEDYLYLNEGYAGKVRIHDLETYAEAEDPVTVVEDQHTWAIFTSKKYDKIVVLQGDDSFGPGAVFLINKDDWSVELVENLGGNYTLFSGALHKNGFFVGGNGVLKGYDWDGYEILDEPIENVVYNMGVVGDSLIYSHSLSSVNNTEKVSIRSVNDLDFIQDLGRYPHGIRGTVDNKTFCIDSMPTGQLTTFKF